MVEVYLIWHTQRQGWISRSSGTTTDLADAQPFDRSVAVERCRGSKDHNGTYAMIPVMKDDLL